MTLPNGSASGTSRTFSCPAWLSLPRSERGEDEDREHGTVGHGFVSAVLRGTATTAALAGMSPADRKTCEGLDWGALVGDFELSTLESEAAFAVDMRGRTARRLGHDVRRDYQAAAKALGKRLGAYEVPGSTDILGRHRHTGRRLVVDMKFGWEDVEPAATNGQLLFFAAALYLLDGETEIEGRIAKIKPDGSIRYRADQTAVYTPLDLETYLDTYEAKLVEAKAARALVRKRRLPTVTTGPWCRWCDAADACPGRMRIVRTMLPELQTIGERVETMTRPELVRAWLLWKHQIHPLEERVEEALREAIARVTLETEGVGLDLDNGKMAKAITYPRDDLSESDLLALVRKLGGTDEQIAACVKTKVVTQVREVNKWKKRRGRAA